MASSVELMKLHRNLDAKWVLPVAALVDSSPYAGSVKNLVDLFLRFYWKPQDPSKLPPIEKAYYVHIHEKSLFQAIVLCIPFVGTLLNILIFLPMQFYYRHTLKVLEEGDMAKTRQMYAGSVDDKAVALEGALTATNSPEASTSIRGIKCLAYIYHQGSEAHKKITLERILNIFENEDRDLYRKCADLYGNTAIPEVDEAILETCFHKDQLDPSSNFAAFIHSKFDVMPPDARQRVISWYIDAADEDGLAALMAFDRIKEWIRSDRLRYSEFNQLCQWLLEQVETSHADTAMLCIHELLTRCRSPQFITWMQQSKQRVDQLPNERRASIEHDFNQLRGILGELPKAPVEREAHDDQPKVNAILEYLASAFRVSCEEIDSYQKLNQHWKTWERLNDPTKALPEQQEKAKELFAHVTGLRQQLFNLWAQGLRQNRLHQESATALH